jgi:fatty-acyl-CoA synthase
VSLVGAPPAGLLEQNGWRPTLFQEMAADGKQVSEEERSTRQASVRPHDPAQIQYTSGTTGFPKGAILHHYGILNNAMLFAQRWELRQSDRYCNPMPFFHTAGCVMAVLGTLSVGSTLHPLLAFDPLKALQIIGHERCTFSVGVPTMLIAIMQHPDFTSYDLSSLKHVLSGVLLFHWP